MDKIQWDFNTHFQFLFCEKVISNFQPLEGDINSNMFVFVSQWSIFSLPSKSHQWKDCDIFCDKKLNS